MTIDIDAIRKLTDAADPAPWTAHPDGLVWSQLIGDPVSGSTEVENAEFIAAARTHVPALCDEVEQLRAELAKARRERDEYAADNTRVAVSLVDVQRQLTAANHHTDNLAADVRDMQKANTAYANENARLRRQLADIACLKCWTNEDGKRFIFVADIQTAMGVPTDKAGVAR